ncbi:site-specific integrase [Kitasatospora sp. NPDC058965]|uniref:site-specific integrase n=1 Tax=Kitasatospora sp. NPDC058965 TaxID=3346682 RepID=UPI0036A1E273
MLSFDVEIWAIRNLGRGRKPHQLRWRVGSERHSRTFATFTMADGRRAELLAARNRGEPFDVETGLPGSEFRERAAKEAQVTWFDHAKKFAEVEWPASTAKERAARADGLATLTPALVTDHRGAPPARVLRRALSTVAFNFSPHRPEPPAELAAALAWLARKSVLVTQLDDSDTVRRALAAITLKLDGTRAADNTINRKYATFSGALRYAIERKLLVTHPLKAVRWSPPEVDTEIDFRWVPAPRQARDLVLATQQLGPRGKHLTAFYGAISWAATRPAEATNLRDTDFELPETGWGLILAPGSASRVGSRWTDDGQGQEERGLKHRPKNSVRRIPIPPVYVQMVRQHIATYGLGPDRRVFQSATGGLLTTKETSDVWKAARRLVLTPEEQATELADVEYALRAACISGWLVAGMAPVEAAYRAGHSVAVLYKFYAKVLAGLEDHSNGLVERFLGQQYGEA